MRLKTPQEAARFLHKAVGTLAYWRCAGIGPAYIKMGKTVLYDEEVLESFVKKHVVYPSVQAAMEENNVAL